MAKFVCYRDKNGPTLVGRGDMLPSGVVVQCEPVDKSDFITGIRWLSHYTKDDVIRIGDLEIRRAR